MNIFKEPVKVKGEDFEFLSVSVENIDRDYLLENIKNFSDFDLPDYFMRENIILTRTKENYLHCRDFKNWVLPFIVAGVEYWICREYNDWQNKYYKWLAIKDISEKGAVVIISGDHQMPVGSFIEGDICYYSS